MSAWSALTDDMETDFLAGGGDMGALMRTRDWSGTALGAPANWPQSLKTAVGIMLSSRYAMFVWWGRKLTNLYNDAYRPFLGTKHPQALGESARHVWAEIWHLIGPRTEAVLERAESTFDEALLLVMERFGFPEETYFTFSYSPLRDDRGKVGGIFCAVTEETSRIIGERRLRLLREVAATSPEAETPEQVCFAASECIARNSRDLPFALLYVVEPDGRSARLAAHAGVSDLRSLGADQVIELGANRAAWPLAQAKLGSEALLIDDLPLRFDNVPTGAWDRPPVRAVIMPLAKQGQTEIAGFLIAGLNPYLPFEDEYRGFIGLLAGQIAAGIANAQAHQEERRRALALAELDRAKTTFFSNVSHEFRTPLTLMLGPLEDMLAGRAGQLPPDKRSLIMLAHSNGLRLLKLVNSLLDFSRIEAGRAQATYQPVELGSFTRDLVSNFRSACQKAGLFLDVDCPDMGEPVHIDPDMWEKIVLNLLSNAFKYTLRGGISVAVRADGARAVLSVRDTGIGIPVNEIPHLFERFHRVEGAHGRTHEGTGIGLALVNELVKLHGGSITAESVFGAGSTFTVSLPIGTSHLPQDRVSARSTHAPTAVAARAYVEEALRWLPDGDRTADRLDEISPGDFGSFVAPDRGSNQGSVLLVDDNADMRDYVRRLLETCYEVKTARDGQEALAVLKDSRLDLVITDVMMPRLDGFGLLRAIRSDPTLAEVPVILLSARAGEESSIEGLNAGADDYLVKPFSVRELLARVRATLDLTRLRRRSRDAEASARALEQRLQVARNASGTGTFIWNVQSDTVESDEALDRLFELPPEEGTRHASSLFERIHPDDLPGVMARIRSCRDGAGDLDAEFRITRTDGSIRWLYGRGKMLNDEAGRTDCMAGAVVDVSDRKRSQELKMFLAAIVESSDDAVVGKNLDGVVTSWNQAAEVIFGYTAHEMLGQPITRIFPADRTYEEDRIRQRMRRGERVEQFETVGRRKDGTELEVSVTISPVRDESGGIVGASTIVRDITERRRAEEALRESEERLRVLNETLEQRLVERTRALNIQISERLKVEAALAQAQRLEAIAQLTGGVAHDFNNMLTIVLGQAESILIAARGDARVTRMAASIQGIAERGAQLTGQLLAFARRQRLQPQSVKVERLLDTLSLLVRKAAGEAVSVEFRSMPDLWPLEIDLAQFEAAMLNLVVNARDAMPSGGRLVIDVQNTLVSDIEAYRLDIRPGSYVRVSVGDTGSGMEPEVLKRCFEPFFTTKEIGKGTGLGLSQVYGFARQSGGTAEVVSTIGQGTTVSLYIPRAELAREESGVASERQAPVAAAGKTILVVEDQDEVREIVETSLSRSGYRVLSAPDGPSARRILESSEPIDLLLSDIVMPNGVSGMELAEWARRLRQDLKVVIMSGYSRQAQPDCERAVLFLAKPFRPSDLSNVLNTAFAGAGEP